MCQYDRDAPTQGHPHPHTGILQNNEVEKKDKSLTIIGRFLPLIKLDLYFMIIYLCIKYESNTIKFFFLKNIERKTVFEGEKVAITPIIVGGFYPKSNLTSIL